MKTKMTIFKDGATTRLHNRRIYFKHTEQGDFLIGFNVVDRENASSPAARHFCVKSKVRVTEIRLSAEALESLAISYLSFKRRKERDANANRKPDQKE